MSRKTPKSANRQGSSDGGDVASPQEEQRPLMGNPANPRHPSRPLIVVSAVLFLSWLITLGVVASRL